MIAEKMTRIKIRDLLELNEAVDMCSKVMPTKGESHDFIRKFQYAMGRNLVRIKPVLMAAKEAYVAATAPVEEYEEYQDAVAALDVEYPDTKKVDPAKEKHLKLLNRKFRKAIAAQDKKEAEAEKLLDKYVEVSLYHCAFDSLPIGIAGGWKVRLEPLLTGKPEIFSCA